MTPPALGRSGLDRRIVVRAAVQAGIIGWVLSIIPILGIVITGVLAVVLYRRAGGLLFSASAASRVGAAAGIVSFAIFSFFTVVRIVFFHAQKEYQDLMLKGMQAFGMNPADADVEKTVHFFVSPPGLALTLFLYLILSVGLAAIGGVLASALMKPRPPA